MKKILLMLCLTLGVLITAGVNNSYAYESSYFRRFIKSEIEVILDYKEKRTKVLLYIIEVNTRDNELIGLTNSGKVHIPVSNIIYFYEKDKTIQAVHNHYEN